MKFLLFNLAVGAALFYLVTAERGGMHDAADRLYDVTQGARSVMTRAVRDGRRLIDRDGSGVKSTARATTASREADTEIPPPPPPSSGSPVAASPSPPDAVVAGPDLLAPPPVPSFEPAAAASRAGVPKATPEALRRRDLILGSLPAPAPGAAAPAPAAILAPEERRRQLYSLAEEMELLYARSLSR